MYLCYKVAQNYARITTRIRGGDRTRNRSRCLASKPIARRRTFIHRIFLLSWMSIEWII